MDVLNIKNEKILDYLIHPSGLIIVSLCFKSLNKKYRFTKFKWSGLINLAQFEMAINKFKKEIDSTEYFYINLQGSNINVFKGENYIILNPNVMLLSRNFP
jgi:hypothetical protein